jgi:hypothetical protein
MPDAYTPTPPSSTSTTPTTKATAVAEPSPPSQDKVASEVPTPAATPPHMKTTAAASLAASAASRSFVAYCSTAVQTRPPPNGIIFSLIHGRRPTMQDVERRMGLAGIGRYKGPNDMLHGVLFGEAFQREPNEYKSTTTDSGFQTLDPTSRQKAMTKAKAKAAMIASKYKGIATKARCKVFGESKDDKVVHTEGVACSIQLDADGNVQGDKKLTGRFLPNIYRIDIESENDSRRTPQNSASHPSASDTSHKTSPTAISPRDTQSPSAPSQCTASRDTQQPSPIPALQPASPEGREYTEAAGASFEYYAFGYDGFGNVVEVPGPYTTKSDDEFVVIGPKKSPPPPATRKNPRPRATLCKSKHSSHIDAPSTIRSDLLPCDGLRKGKDSSQVDLLPPTGNDLSSQEVTRKRQNSSNINDEEPLQRRKRARTSSPRPKMRKSQDKPNIHEERDEEYSKHRERSLSHPAHTSRTPPPQKCEDHKASRKQEHSSRPVQTSGATSAHEREEHGASRKYKEAPRRSRRDETHGSRRRSKSRAGEESRRCRRASVSSDRDDTRKSRHHSRSPMGRDEDASKPSRNRHDARTARRHSRSSIPCDQATNKGSRHRNNTHTTHRRSRSPARDDEGAERPTRNRNDTRTTRHRSRSPMRIVEETNRSARSDRRENQPEPHREDLGRRTTRAQTSCDSVPGTPLLTRVTPVTPTGASKANTTEMAPAVQTERTKRDVKTKIAERRAKRSERAPLRTYVPPARRR